jgi:uncharacterized sporulation protein YeaH/YhbH (DUF444 family)
MALIIDRRLDAKNKSVVNRQRFLKRFRQQLKRAVADAASGRSITEVDKGERVKIPAKDISEPTFSITRGGRRETIHPGNREFVTGDRVPRPQEGGGRGGRASNTGQGEDDFVFELSRDEFLDLLFEDLELPHLVKKELTRLPEQKLVRAGFTTDGTPTNINVVRSLRGSIARRIAMSASARERLEDLRAQLAQLLADGRSDDPLCDELAEQIASLEAHIRSIPFIDTVDLRYNHRVRRPQPSTQAVMFCIMDVSGSMTQERKDLAKRFFILLYLFLQRNYERIDVVFIRHHTVAMEVDEQEFFHSRETGGTVVSSALTLMSQIVRARYPVHAWNIYAAQASDGDNWPDDSPGCRDIIVNELLPLLQYFAYVEITPSSHQRLWQEYERIAEGAPNFAMRQIDGAADIYPVFRELFARKLA